MALLTLSLLGPPQVARADGTALAFRSRKTLALLIYLAVECQQEHSRDSLLGLLWPEDSEEAARNSLRVALANLRQALGAEADQLLRAGRVSVKFAPAGDHALDVATFSRLLAESRAHRHEQIARCAVCLARLADAVALYRGDFLAGFALADSVAFDEWALVQREELHQHVLYALDTLASAAEEQHDHAALRRYARHQLALEPWRERAHRQLMRGMAGAGERSAALAQYATCCQVLEAELGIEPDEETHALYEQIRTGKRSDKETRRQGDKETERQDSLSPPLPVSLSPRREWSDAPEPGRFYGRQIEVAQLTSWLIVDRCQVIAVLGIGGMGKTTLAAAVVQAVARRFERVIWRSLLNAPPLEELLHPLLQSLTGQALTMLPISLDDQLALLLDYLRKQRCLLVLDNLESLLEADGIGQMRTGYAGYAQLLQRLATSKHQSCLLLTSRERLQGMARWEADLSWVRALRLGGLDSAASQAILSARGLRGQDTDAQGLIARYSGHPLALTLVAETVYELFGGAIGDFLREETLIFDDIRVMLDQQFTRLSALEQEILFWLAIEREPVAAAALRANLVRKPSSGLFLESLRALQRRSLIEQQAAGFTLQNVVIEYLTARLIDGVSAELIEIQTLASTHQPLALPLLNRFALLKAQSKEYVRQSQARLILQPIAAQLVAQLGTAGLAARIQALLERLRATAPRAPGYAGGNLLNLSVRLKIDLSGYDFSQLSVWQADLRGVIVAAVNFNQADLAGSAFTLDFSTYAIRLEQSGQVTVAAPFKKTLSLWRIASGQLHDGFHIPNLSPYPILFSPDGRFLAGCCADHSVRI